MTAAAGLVDRRPLAETPEGRLLFAQVREDPAIEMTALRPSDGGTLVVVGSGGCTALSLLGAGAERVVAVDSNRSQSHLVELKAAAVAILGGPAATALLGGVPASAPRMEMFERVAPSLGAEARAYWRRRAAKVRRGVLRAGVTERFVGGLSWIVRRFVHTPRTIRALLGCTSLDAQRELFARTWNNRRWRAMFRLLLNRKLMTHTYDERLLQRSTVKLSTHFLALLEHGICNLPVATNYFLHQIFTGRYRSAHDPSALPPYLGAPPSEEAVRRRFRIADGDMADYLKTCPDRSVRGFALSNICEWMTDADIDDTFQEILRVAEDGAVVCLRNFVGWTEVPARFSRSLRPDEAVDPEGLIRLDRSLMQRRVQVLRVRREVS